MIRVRDLHLLIDQGLPVPTSVTVRGRIAAARSTRARVFIRLTDPTGTIQVSVVDPRAKPNLGELWEFEGTIDLTSFRGREDIAPRPTIVASRADHLSVTVRVDAGSRVGSDAHQQFLERGVSLAKLRAIGSKIFVQLGFIEVEPKLITLRAPLTGLEPLQVNYVGFGAPAHLFPSPASQLKQILAGTSVTSVFTISRIFTTTFRDESTSYEALTLMAMTVSRHDGSAPELSTLERAVAFFAQEPQLKGVFVDALAEGGRLRAVELTGAPKPLVRPVKMTTLECYAAPSQYLAEPSSLPPKTFQRLVAPERTILAERAVMPWFGAEQLEVTTVHLERLSALFFDTHGRPLTVLRANPRTTRESDL